MAIVSKSKIGIGEEAKDIATIDIAIAALSMSFSFIEARGI